VLRLLTRRPILLLVGRQRVIRLGRRRPFLLVACRRVLTRPGRSVVRRWNLR